MPSPSTSTPTSVEDREKRVLSDDPLNLAGECTPVIGRLSLRLHADQGHCSKQQQRDGVGGSHDTV